ncbi:MAG: phosphate acyltransferase PlsX [Phycisphaerae bacterium]|jgi:glycerol-3-phosphate acyltransferase PlsX
MRIGIDAMGGDRAPVEEVKGALAARQFLKSGDKIVLIGQEDLIRQHLGAAGQWSDFIEIRHADQVVGMAEAPVEALRTKPNSSLSLMSRMHAAGEIDACISAGNTGACVASAQMRLRRLRGVHRPGIAILTPTYHGPVAVCDVGANVNCRPAHLLQYGIMASVYVKAVCGVNNPRVALLSIGEEEAKGNELVKQTRQLMKEDPCVHFVGNVEGRDLFRGVCDVMICEGFVGNVVLKLMEGMAEGIVKSLLEELLATMPNQEKLIRQAAKNIATKYDYNEYGGAPLLGVSGIFIICHGASNYRGIMNAVRVARDFAAGHVNEQIMELLGPREGGQDGDA